MDRDRQYLLSALVYLKYPYDGGFRPNLTQIDRAGTLKDKTREGLEREIRPQIGGSLAQQEDLPATIAGIVNKVLNNPRLEKKVVEKLKEKFGTKGASAKSGTDRWEVVRDVLNDLRLEWTFPGHEALQITKALRIPYIVLDEEGNPIKDPAGNPLTYHMVIAFTGSH